MTLTQTAWATIDRMTTGRQGDGQEPIRVPTKVLKQELSARLLAWDPIGVSDLPEAAGEYDCLIDPLMRRLNDGASTTAIASYLRQELEDHFALDSDDEREAALATDLTAWWARVTTQRA
jgi:hypothetical protein